MQGSCLDCAAVEHLLPAASFDFLVGMSALSSLLGDKLLTKDGEKATDEVLQGKDAVGLYFSAHCKLLYCSTLTHSRQLPLCPAHPCLRVRPVPWLHAGACQVVREHEGGR